MSWHPNDLVSDADLRDYEASILTSFGETTWHGKRTKALEDWLFPILAGRGFDPYALITRVEAAQAFAVTGGVYSDVTAALRDTVADDLNLAAVFATAANDALYIGSAQPFRGLYVRIEDQVSSVAATVSVRYWNGAWTALQVSDATMRTADKTLSGGGSIGWVLPYDWAVRSVNGSARLYWAKVMVSATPTGARTGQLATIRASVLRAPAAFRTLELIFREAPIQDQGPWDAKADYYAKQADDALQRAFPLLGAEFDADTSDQVSQTEQGQTAEEAGYGGWTLERA